MEWKQVIKKYDFFLNFLPVLRNADPDYFAPDPDIPDPVFKIPDPDPA